MGTSTELMGRELARQIHALAALKEERKEKLADFRTREQSILKEIMRLALDVRTGQGALYHLEKKEP
jgi:hypothetical protein